MLRVKLSRELLPFSGFFRGFSQTHSNLSFSLNQIFRSRLAS